MRTSFLWMTALVAALSPVAAAASPALSTLSAGPASASVLVMPIVDPAAAVIAGGAAPASFGLATPFVGGIRYRPRAYRERASVMPTTTQVHAGFFDPTDNFSTGFSGGFRAGPQVDPHVQIGIAVDWWHKAQSERTSLGTVPLPGGQGSEELVLSRSTANLLPILGFVQVSGDENMPVIPYVGVGVGYEWLFLSADDFVTGESFDQTFGGFGWQLWGGAGVPLSGRARLNGEVFYNGSEVGSDVDVLTVSGVPVTVRDIVKMNGVGMRVGLSWGF
jgi:hypothetical protein